MALLYSGLYKNMKNLKLNFFELKTLGSVKIIWERQSSLADIKIINKRTQLDFFKLFFKLKYAGKN